MDLKEIILSEQNIYNAIFSVHSYIYDVGLLEEDDIKLYYQLKDCYNWELIGNKDSDYHGLSVIQKCKKRLSSLLNNPNNLFEVSVFFKPKNFKDGKITYRPIHSASLIDFICMVAMLQPLMFEYDSTNNKKCLAGLCTLIPQNFYGNVPSEYPRYLFNPWKKQYKKYSDTVISTYKKLLETEEYKQEVILDLENFFPSVSPFWIAEYIYKNLNYKWTTDRANSKTLKLVLYKLLFQKLKGENFSNWKQVYYKLDVSDKNGNYYTMGIAQGLPQAYFFGNLIMVEIAKETQKTFKGKSYYYVDDSVTYTNGIINTVDFKSKIENLNDSLSDLFSTNEKPYTIFYDFKDEPCVIFQNQIRDHYKIKYHTNDKSFFQNIDKDDYGGILYLLAKETSLAGQLYDNADDIDNKVSVSKLTSILEMINAEMEKLKKKGEYEDMINRIKMLTRLRRFYLFRQQKLELSDKDKLSVHIVDEFIDRIQLQKDKEFFENYGSEIFETEARYLLSICDQEGREYLLKQIIEKESIWTDTIGLKPENQFLSQSFKMVNRCNKYYSLYTYYDSLKWIIETTTKKYSQNKKKNEITLFLSSPIAYVNSIIQCPSEQVATCSDEYNRRILNAVFSNLFDIEISDSMYIVKINKFQNLRYFELRILVYLRNRRFTMNDFVLFLKEMSTKENLETSSIVESSLLPVLGLIADKVKDSRQVDCIIQTHRLVSGLWMNGSKFLHSYTLHNQDHAISLIRLSIKLLKNLDYLELKRNDYFILFMACYLHDISMVINPTSEKFIISSPESNSIATDLLIKMKCLLKEGKDKDIKECKSLFLQVFNQVYSFFSNYQREHHPDESASFISKRGHTFLDFVEPYILDLVSDIGISHGLDADEIYGIRSEAHSKQFSVKYIKILLRLVDVLDISSDRVNYFLLKESMEHFSTISKFHWISHYITDKVIPHSEYKYIKAEKGQRTTIQETFNIDIYYRINNNLTFQKKAGCENCLFASDSETNKYILQIDSENTICSQPKNSLGCPLMCIWTQLKHNYLFKELKELQNYLNIVNSPYIKSNIRVQIFLNNNIQLDKELFDTVINYINENVNKGL